MKNNPDSTLEREKTTQDRLTKLERTVRVLLLRQRFTFAWIEAHPEYSDLADKLGQDFESIAEEDLLDISLQT
jgi:hypothetical protein